MQTASTVSKKLSMINIHPKNSWSILNFISNFLFSGQEATLAPSMTTSGRQFLSVNHNAEMRCMTSYNNNIGSLHYDSFSP